MAIRKTSAEYFSHDADASEDEKVMYLEAMFGFMGYALYFKMLERLCRSDNFEMKFGPIQRQVLARHFGVTVEQLNDFVVAATSCDIVAFRIDGETIWSDGLKKRMSWLLEKRQRDAERIAQKRAENAGKTHNTLQKEYVAATSVQVKESKVKESKEERENAHAEKSRPLPEEIKKNPPPSSARPPSKSAWQPADPDTELDEMLSDQLCEERFFRQCQIPREKFRPYIEAFRLKVKSEQATHTNRRDFRSHFFSWASLEFARTKKQENGSPKLTFDNPDTIREGLEFAERWKAERDARRS